MPLYAFKNEEDEIVGTDYENSAKDGHLSFLHNLLLGQWEDRMNKGMFRYDVTSCETKIIPGSYGFIAQLNEGRHLKKRPTEFRIDQVLQPFDENKFNFKKVGQEEVLFRFESSHDNKSHYVPCSPVEVESPSVVAINVSPIEYGHVLLIPCLLDCLPQRIDRDSFMLALRWAKEAADPYFRVGYNSLGAFATINHLHFQAYYLSVPFPVEKAPTCRILTRIGLNNAELTVSQLLNYPVRGFVFEGGWKLQDLADFVASTCIYFQNNNIPFNVLITDCGKKIFVFLQCYAEKQALGEVSQELLATQVNPAVWEISGHIVLKRRKDYDDASEDYVWRLLSEVSMTEERFKEVKAYVVEAAKLESATGDNTSKSKESIDEPCSPEVPSMPRDCLVLH
ncbi:hypothetical protein Leryth_015460 [Lithospermum erythrorhizon]|nr:hypothetical protein Leryth_015460 [Lithospermum erythrorhizon]